MRVVSLVGLAADLAIESMSHRPIGDGKREYRMPYDQGNQLIALLLMTRNAAEAKLVEVAQ